MGEEGEKKLSGKALTYERLRRGGRGDQEAAGWADGTLRLLIGRTGAGAAAAANDRSRAGIRPSACVLLGARRCACSGGEAGKRPADTRTADSPLGSPRGPAAGVIGWLMSAGLWIPARARLPYWYAGQVPLCKGCRPVQTIRKKTGDSRKCKATQQCDDIGRVVKYSHVLSFCPRYLGTKQWSGLWTTPKY